METRIVIFASILAPLFLSECASLDRDVPEKEIIGRQTTIAASISGTKTVNEEFSTHWTPGDSINLIWYSNETSDCGSDLFTNISGNEFSGTFTSPHNSNDLYVVYPYLSGNASAKSIPITVSFSQKQSRGGDMSHIAGDGYPLFGIRKSVQFSERTDIPMTNALALAKVLVTNTVDVPITVRRIDLTSSDVVAGDFTVDLTQGNAVWSPVGNASKSISLTVSEGERIPAGGSASFYVGLVPHNASSLKLGVTASRDGGQEIRMEKTSASAITFSEGVMKTLRIGYDDDLSPLLTFNLENDSIAAYLDDAGANYTDDNNSSVVKSYCSNSESCRKDMPSPVTLSWNSEVSGTKTVHIYNNQARTNLEISVTTSTDEVDIYNLIPGRSYWYTVRSDEGRAIASGKFATGGRLRMMKVSDTYSEDCGNNCRDLGGMKTTDGKTIRYNLLFRGTSIDDISISEKEYMTGYMNIGTDVDLRKANKDGEVFGSSWGVSYSNAGYDSFSDLKNKSKTLTTFTDIFNTVTSGKACYIHCLTGADRTGYICLLIEAVLGISAKDCSIDYELTSFSVANIRNRSSGSGARAYFPDGLDYINGYEGSSFREKAENILLDAGLTGAQIDAFRQTMLE